MSSYNISDIIFTDCLIASASGIYTYNTTFLLKLRPSALVQLCIYFYTITTTDTVQLATMTTNHQKKGPRDVDMSLGP